jgi:Putative DNA-binding domain
MDNQAQSWSEELLLALVGQSESSRLEFKSGRLFDQDRDKWVETLSTEVSAFANSEGGTLVLGMAERKEGKTPVAAGLDGINAAAVPMPWLQQVLESNVSPYLTGLRLKAVPLSGDLVGRVCIVVTVPAGTTAYQAKDRRYYGRSEFQVQPLPDHEVRLRMQRGRMAAGTLEVEPFDLSWTPPLRDTGSSGESEAEPPSIDVPNMENWNFRFVVHNTSQVTIRGFCVTLFLEVRPPANVGYAGQLVGHEVESDGTFSSEAHQRVFPDRRVSIGDGIWTLAANDLKALAPGEALAHWKLFLDDAPASSGVLDLVEEYRKK